MNIRPFDQESKIFNNIPLSSNINITIYLYQLYNFIFLESILCSLNIKNFSTVFSYHKKIKLHHYQVHHLLGKESTIMVSLDIVGRNARYAIKTIISGALKADIADSVDTTIHTIALAIKLDNLIEIL